MLFRSPPVAFDCDYVRALGYGAVDFLLKQDTPDSKLHGALVCLVEGKIEYLDFAALLDPTTGKSRVRHVNTATQSYKVAREYMIRLEKEDFADAEKLKLLAQAASTPSHTTTPSEFRSRFEHLVST